MDNNFEELNNEFIKIKNCGWVRSLRNGSTGVGYTFEHLLGKSEDNFDIPDYKNIEIKTIRKTSLKKLHLFNATPDGDYLFPIKRVLDTLGYPDKTNNDFKVLNMDFSTKEFTKIGYYKKAKIEVDNKNRKIDLIAFNNTGDNLNVDISWSFDLLNERLRLKMTNLA